ncbi:hypothetical protein LCGC14_2182830 [marine sediment metagenome]|uniref:Uncharacterized protein n=1 Tax=marine sediment metagenome TaxID=412755 RepID=A0A0F9E8T8_9ZZZZ
MDLSDSLVALVRFVVQPVLHAQVALTLLSVCLADSVTGHVLLACIWVALIATAKTVFVAFVEVVVGFAALIG